MILLNPGPVVLSERVRQALTAPDLCHREPEFYDLQDRIRASLLAVYGLSPENWAAVLLSGSGTAAVEAMVTSLVPQNGRLVVVENGVYGERLTTIARTHAIPVVPVTHEWGAEIDLERLASALDSDPRPTHLAVVHHETTTGRLNQLGEIGALCHERQIGLLLDAVSSFGAEPLEFEGWGISACAIAANKCLHGAPGIAMVCTHRDALPGPNGINRSVYLDLGTYLRAQDQRDTPFTPAVHTCYALAAALDELLEEGGWSVRRTHYRQLADQVMQGLQDLGIKPLLPAEASSVVLRAYRLPADITYDNLHDGLKARGFIIYAGQGGLARRIFRVSTMGAITEADMERFLNAISAVLREPRSKDK
jgi:2-aminoethylphosphonate-pyruvate transaminase